MIFKLDTQKVISEPQTGIEGCGFDPRGWPLNRGSTVRVVQSNMGSNFNVRI